MVKPGAKYFSEFEELLSRMCDGYSQIATSTQDLNTHADAKSKYILIDQLLSYYKDLCTRAENTTKEKPPGCVCDMLDRVKLKKPNEDYIEIPTVSKSPF